MSNQFGFTGRDALPAGKPIALKFAFLNDDNTPFIPIGYTAEFMLYTRGGNQLKLWTDPPRVAFEDNFIVVRGDESLAAGSYDYKILAYDAAGDLVGSITGPLEAET